MKLPKVPKSYGVTYDEVLEICQTGTRQELAAISYDTVAARFSEYLDKCSDDQLFFLSGHFSGLVHTPGDTEDVRFSQDVIRSIREELKQRSNHRDTEAGISFFFDEVRKLEAME